MIDHILDPLDLADGFAANADRFAKLRFRSRQSHGFIRRCYQAAERERAEAVTHAITSGFDLLVVAQEHAASRRLRQHSLDQIETLTLADVCWLRAVARHGRYGSRNFRRAIELLFLAEALLGAGSKGNAPPRHVEANSAVGILAGGAEEVEGCLSS